MPRTKGSITLGELTTLDISGPPKLFLLRLPHGTMQDPALTAIIRKAIKDLNIKELGHRFIIMDADFIATEADDAALAAIGLMRKPPAKGRK